MNSLAFPAEYIHMRPIGAWAGNPAFLLFGLVASVFPFRIFVSVAVKEPRGMKAAGTTAQPRGPLPAALSFPLNHMRRQVAPCGPNCPRSFGRLKDE
jgi:hypothetical protein